MDRYLPACQAVVFNGADDPFHVIGMNPCSGFRVNFFQHGVQDGRRGFPFPGSQFLQFPPHRTPVLIFLEINVIKKRLYIETGASCNDRDTAAVIDSLQRLLCHVLECDHIEILVRFQHINEVMGDPLHLISRNLGRANIHVPVYLHGIGADDLTSYGLCQLDGQGCFSDCRWAGQYNKRLLHMGAAPFSHVLVFPWFMFTQSV